jgi:hypothetical protein
MRSDEAVHLFTTFEVHTQGLAGMEMLKNLHVQTVIRWFNDIMDSSFNQ